jgi:alpha-tubulin suppressor-like RCC1 family protein
MVLDPYADLKSWGNNSVGQVGDLTTVNRNAPKYVATAFDFALGMDHSIAIRPTGEYEAWGLNGNGQLGDGTLTNNSFALITVGLPNYPADAYKAFALGRAHTLALGTDGVLWGWGDNSFGQLGDGTQLQLLTRVQILTGVTAIATHESHNLALKADGTLWAWGKNTDGQVGNGTQVNQLTPVQIGTGYALIACGSDHSLAVKTDGTVWAWGLDNFGQLGDGITAPRQLTPHQVGAF